MEIIQLNTASRLEKEWSYSRAISVGDWVFVSLTSGMDYATRILPPDATGQAEQCLRNVSAALEALGCSLADVVRSHVVIPYPDDVSAVMAVVARHFRGIDPTSAPVCAPIGAPEFRVEIEVTAMRGAAAAPRRRVELA